MTLKNSRVLVTGGAGFLGSWVVKRLKKEQVKEIIIPRSKDADLRDKDVCRTLVSDVDVIFHLAAHVGGIALNKAHPGQLFYDNAMMGIQLIEEARIAGVDKMLVVGTACSYPKYCPVPFREEDLWNGYPDETTGVYGLAKKMLLVQAQAYRQEYKFNCIYMIPGNLYGPGDNFHETYGHVIPSLIMRMVEAKKKKHKEFLVWGSGVATREFLYGEDAAEALVTAMKTYDGGEPINIGTSREISIRDVVVLLKSIIGFNGDIVWDPSKPDGQPRRSFETTRAKEWFGFTAKTPLEVGLKRTVEWYLKQI